MQNAALLIVLSGLPGTGKSTLGRALAERMGAMWIRIDSIEAAIRASGIVRGSLHDSGYRAAHAVAEDNLRLGRTVIADCVNPWMLTRDAWRDVAARAGARSVEIETICSDESEHRRRIETRTPDIDGLTLPTWAEVTARDYRPWERERLVVETSARTVQACVEQVYDVAMNLAAS